MRMHYPRLLVRSGSWPGLDPRDYHPRNEAELKEACRNCMRKYNRPPSLVGSGWAYFLRRERARGPRVFLHNFKGIVTRTVQKGESARLLDTEERWASGSTIEQVNKHLEKLEYRGDDVPKDPSGRPVQVRGYALSTHPTMSYISLGSWFACGNHGTRC